MNYSYPPVPDDFLDDIIKVFLLGIERELRDDRGNKIPGVIARIFPDHDPRYFPYIVEWKTLFKIRKAIIASLKGSDNKLLHILANVLEVIHKDYS